DAGRYDRRRWRSYQARCRHACADSRQYVFRWHAARNRTLGLANNQALGTGALTPTASVVDYVGGVTNPQPIIANSNTTQLQVTTGTATQAGVISELNGPRPLEKIGAGTLVLTAPNTYSGPTTISAGTLVLGNGGSILGNVVDNGTFAVNR